MKKTLRFEALLFASALVLAGCSSQGREGEESVASESEKASSKVLSYLKTTPIKEGRLLEEQAVYEKLDQLAGEGCDVDTELVGLVGHEDPELRSAAATLLGRWYAGSKTPLLTKTNALIGFMGDEAWTARRNAVLAYRWAYRPNPGGDRDVATPKGLEARPQDHVSAIRKLFGDSNEHVRTEAAITLGEWGGAEVVPTLLEELRSADVKHRASAILAIRSLYVAKGGANLSAASREELRIALTKAKDEDAAATVRALAKDALTEVR